MTPAQVRRCLALLALAQVLGCGSSPPSPCTPGQVDRACAVTACAVGAEGCACTTGGSCDSGLACRAGKCAPTGTAKHYVFVTSATWPGLFWRDDFASTPFLQADARCTTAAQGAGLAGAWRAWLSGYGVNRADGTLMAAQRAPDHLEEAGPWFLVGTDTVAFNNRAQLSNTPLVAINVDEVGRVIPSGAVWTGTDSSGGIGEDCGQWSVSSGHGTVGELSSTSSAWTNARVESWCSAVLAHLYCFQQ